MKTHWFYGNQQNNASRLISAEIGALILQNPGLITDYENTRKALGIKISGIFYICEQTYKAYEKQSPDEIDSTRAKALMRDENFAKKMGYQLEVIQKAPRDNLLIILDKPGTLLQATMGHETISFGKLEGHYWRFDPLYTGDSSAFIIYDNESEFKDALRKLNNPSFNLLKINVLAPAVQNTPLKSKL